MEAEVWGRFLRFRLGYNGGPFVKMPARVVIQQNGEFFDHWDI